VPVDLCSQRSAPTVGAADFAAAFWLNGRLLGKPRCARVQIHENWVLPGLGGQIPALLVHEPTVSQMPMMILYDWGIHPIDTMRFLVGKIERAYARTSHISPLVRGVDMALVIMEFQGVSQAFSIAVGEHILLKIKSRSSEGMLIPLSLKARCARSSSTLIRATQSS